MTATQACPECGALPDNLASHTRRCPARAAREARLDRWMEAVYGGRLRFHAALLHPRDRAELPFWRRAYDRWRELYNAGQAEREAADQS